MTSETPYPWIVNINCENDPREGVKVRHIVSANDGDVCNSIITHTLLTRDESPKYVIDIGVDEGWWSFFVADVCGPRVEIDAFEPNPESYKKLLPYLDTIPQLRLHNCAISDKPGILPLTIESGQSNSRQESGSQSVDVPCVTIDEYISDRRVDVIKIDTEGHDIYILKSLHKYMKQIDAIVFEFTVYWYGSSKDECIRVSIEELTHLREHYKHMYLLSRRGQVGITDISDTDLNTFVNFCYDNHYQTDIVVCNKDIV